MVYFAFLRAINVGGSTKLSMAELRQFFTELGMGNVKTLLATGNVRFECDERDVIKLAALLRTETEKRFGLSTEFLVRTPSEIVAIVDQNPFPQEAVDDPSHLVILFAGGPTTEEREESLRSAIKGREYFCCIGNNFYFMYPDNIGDSKLTIKMIEKHLGVPVTGRNWNTVLKLRAMAQEV